MEGACHSMAEQLSRFDQLSDSFAATKNALIASKNPVVPTNHGDQDGQGGHGGKAGDPGQESGVDTIDRVDLPKMYRVILLNDDFTPMDFVILVLRRFFSKTEEQATQIMLDVHKKGAGVAGVFTLEIAEMKAMQVNQLSRSNQYPLKCNIEPEAHT